jgi:hypothetical protein
MAKGDTSNTGGISGNRQTAPAIGAAQGAMNNRINPGVPRAPIGNPNMGGAVGATIGYGGIGPSRFPPMQQTSGSPFAPVAPQINPGIIGQPIDMQPNIPGNTGLATPAVMPNTIPIGPQNQDAIIQAAMQSASPTINNQNATPVVNQPIQWLGQTPIDMSGSKAPGSPGFNESGGKGYTGNDVGLFGPGGPLAGIGPSNQDALIKLFMQSQYGGGPKVQ